MGYVMELRRSVGSRPVIIAGAGVMLINEKGEVLLQKRRDNGFWDYPAGSMEIGESFEECARREVLEETGLTCGKLEFFMEMSGKDSFYEYPNGDQTYAAAILYICRDFSGELKIQEDEVLTQAFFSLDDIPEKSDPRGLGIFDRLREFLAKE